MQRLSELAGNEGPSGSLQRDSTVEVAWSRDDITAVLNALRCGVDLTELLAFGPGLRPRRLLAAYRALDLRRTDAVAAWYRVVAEPRHTVLGEFGPLAARLVSVPVYRLTEAFDSRRGQVLEEVVQQVSETMRRVHAQISVIESHMERAGRAGFRDDARRLSMVLYHPYVPGLWGHPYHLSARVGALSSARVASLLEPDP